MEITEEFLRDSEMRVQGQTWNVHCALLKPNHNPLKLFTTLCVKLYFRRGMSFLPSLTPPVKAFDLIKLPTSPDEIGKRSAARRAIDEYVTSGMSIGVGSGSTIVYGIQRLAERVWGDEGLKIQCVATSFQTREVSVCARVLLSLLLITLTLTLPYYPKNHMCTSFFVKQGSM